MTSEADEPAALARRTLADYYAAIGSHSAEGMLSCVADDVEVTFLEPERNWRGKATAEEKFRGWFERCPDVRVEWDVTSVEASAGASEVQAVISVDFGSGRHDMAYTLRGGLISRIEHR